MKSLDEASVAAWSDRGVADVASAMAHAPADHILVASALDAAFYGSQLGVRESPENLTRHFMAQGWRAGLDPAPWFSVRRYILHYGDVGLCGENPFVHYLRDGRTAKYRTFRSLYLNNLADEIGQIDVEFDVAFYLNAYPDIMANQDDPVEHYCLYGWREGREPAPWFSTRCYLAQNPDVATRRINPFLHYITEGRRQGRAVVAPLACDPAAEKRIIGEAFDSDWYRCAYADIDASVDPLEHFCLYGYREGRDPAAWFSTRAYLEQYPEVARSGVNAILHYLMVGRHNGYEPKLPEDVVARRTVLVDFDAQFYRDTYPDIDKNRIDPVEHYCSFGWQEGRDPAPWFSTRLYARRYPDVVGDPFLHYLTIGKREGRHIYPAAKTDLPRRLLCAADAVVIDDPHLTDLVRYPPTPLHREARSSFDPGHLDIHWVVPDFVVGSGGHMTIFRCIKWLEIFGHSCTIWLDGLTQHDNVESAYDDIARAFQSIRAPVRLFDETFYEASGDIAVATAWSTAAKVGHGGNFRERFYFVQDFEPAFYPRGSYALAAELTYAAYDFACICASSWLAQMMHTTYGRWAAYFPLAYDADVYHRQQRVETCDPPRIAVYARISTARRAVEVAMLALQQLADAGLAFEVDLFGADPDWLEASFPCTVHGVLAPDDLARLYRRSTLGICFSSTNHSLVPQEMMATGLAVLELDVPSTRAIYPDGVVTFCGPHPLAISEAIRSLLEQPERRAAQVARATEWVTQFSWEKSFRLVETALLQRLRDRGYRPRRRRIKPARPSVSVCIPTYNGGALLQSVIDSVRRQVIDKPAEIVVIDSSSTDGSTEFLRDADDVVFRRIPQREFGHGRTRNACAELASGDLLCFLTQDAMPANGLWLSNMVAGMQHHPDSAGAFGRHRAWPSASPFTRRDIDGHFARLAGYPLAIGERSADWVPDDHQWMQMAHFFSDNNSCMRREVWRKIPYPDVSFGEDQLWARDVLAAGYQRLYIPAAIVYHSHDFDVTEAAERARIEANYFLCAFGYRVYDDQRSFEDQLADLDAEDRAWGRAHDVDDAVIERRMLINRACLWARFTAQQEAETARC